MYKAKYKMIMLKRKGSVLLQTLVMCIILSYIAVTLTQWVLSRFTSSSSLSDTMELSSMGYDAPSHDFSSTLLSCFNHGNTADCAATGFSNYSYESYYVYGGYEPGPCWEGAGDKHWTATPTVVNNGGSTTKIQKVVHTLYLPYDNSAQVNSCLGT